MTVEPHLQFYFFLLWAPGQLKLYHGGPGSTNHGFDSVTPFTAESDFRRQNLTCKYVKVGPRTGRVQYFDGRRHIAVSWMDVVDGCICFTRKIEHGGD